MPAPIILAAVSALPTILKGIELLKALYDNKEKFGKIYETVHGFATKVEKGVATEDDQLAVNAKIDAELDAELDEFNARKRPVGG